MTAPSTTPVVEGRQMKTLDQITELFRAYRTAQDLHLQAYRQLPEQMDYYNEDHIRAKISADIICARVVKTENAYREACDEFFAKGCADLIQLLVDVDEHFDGQEDINGNGGPNIAMRLRPEIERFIGPPVPATSKSDVTVFPDGAPFQ